LYVNREEKLNSPYLAIIAQCSMTTTAPSVAPASSADLYVYTKAKRNDLADSAALVASAALAAKAANASFAGSASAAYT
jgi:hypothetical protein